MVGGDTGARAGCAGAVALTAGNLAGGGVRPERMAAGEIPGELHSTCRRRAGRRSPWTPAPSGTPCACAKSGGVAFAAGGAWGEPVPERPPDRIIRLP